MQFYDKINAMRIIHTILRAILLGFLCIAPLRAESTQPDENQVESVHQDEIRNTMNNSAIARTQKPIKIRTDRETLDYFIEHVDELAKHKKGFTHQELILDAKGNGKYDIQIPSKKIIGDFALAERQADKAIYFGHGKAESFLHFAGAIVLEVGYTMQNDGEGGYADVTTGVYLGFDNPAVAVLAVVTSPILNPQLDKLIAKFSKRTQKVVEAAYAEKKGQATP